MVESPNSKNKQAVSGLYWTIENILSTAGPGSFVTGLPFDDG